MRLVFLLILSLYESTNGQLQVTSTRFTSLTEISMTTKEKLPLLQLVATPDNPVAAGQTVRLHCSASPMSAFATWSWQRLQNQTWKEVAVGRELILTEPQQSGVYRCHAESGFSQGSVSQNHTVLIVSMKATVAEKLGIAAFVLSLVVLISIIAGLLWLGCQSVGATATPSSDRVKGVAAPEVTSKGGFPQVNCDGDVYINYTSNNHAYTDLDPTSKPADNVYSSLS
ncbi:uncharacterized protein LOC133462489 [Cololabis saira]|uniref:uncharacterized protein LOC133462489 n=1 Tax=Cololabis saira TaxID=129043 RepID=UPI002AD4EC7D|nr:uncharacterized protein LOC133462489 [Cololabis saira]